VAVPISLNNQTLNNQNAATASATVSHVPRSNICYIRLNKFKF